MGNQSDPSWNTTEVSDINQHDLRKTNYRPKLEF